RAFPVTGNFHRKIPRSKQLGQHRHSIFVVIDRENASTGSTCRHRRLGLLPDWNGPQVFGEGKSRGEGAAEIRSGAGRLNRASVKGNQALNHLETDPETALTAIDRALSLGEEIKDA